jgi:hypothetical protein
LMPEERSQEEEVLNGLSVGAGEETNQKGI